MNVSTRKRSKRRKKGKDNDRVGDRTTLGSGQGVDSLRDMGNERSSANLCRKIPFQHGNGKRENSEVPSYVEKSPGAFTWKRSKRREKGKDDATLDSRDMGRKPGDVGTGRGQSYTTFRRSRGSAKTARNGDPCAEGKDSPVYTGLDTETFQGRAVLICTPDNACYPKTWRDCWHFLDTNGPDFICWNVSYDARAMLAFLPGTVLRALRKWGTAKHRDWQIVFKGRKSLSVSKGSWSVDGHTKDDLSNPLKFKANRTVRLWDAYPYYESSLDAAAEKFLQEKKIEVPQSWLEDMKTAIRDHREEVERYCLRDASLTERLWQILEKQYLELGVKPWRAASPASLAIRAFPESFKLKGTPRFIQDIFLKSYYGGRAEIYWRGNIGPAVGYDIHSAYPSALADMPDPRGCTAVRTESQKPRADAAYGSYKVRMKIHPDTLICPVPFRPRSGPLVYPSGVFTTWVTKPELQILREFGFEYKITYGLELLRESDKMLFPDLREWFRMRQENPACSWAIKKTLNSLYGKLAETRRVRCKIELKPGESLPRNAEYVDGSWTERKRIRTSHTHFAVAAAVTGECRAKLFRAMMEKPEAIAAVHTDGIISREKLPLKLGDGLGEWGQDYVTPEMILIGCGMYLYRTGPDEWREKTRGFHMKQSLRTMATCQKAKCGFKLKHALTLADAERRGWRSLNVMLDIEKVIDSNMDVKRVWPVDWLAFQDVFKHKQHSRALVLVSRDVAFPRRRRKKKSK